MYCLNHNILVSKTQLHFDNTKHCAATSTLEAQQLSRKSVRLSQRKSGNVLQNTTGPVTTLRLWPNTITSFWERRLVETVALTPLIWLVKYQSVPAWVIDLAPCTAVCGGSLEGAIRRFKDLRVLGAPQYLRFGWLNPAMLRFNQTSCLEN